MKTLSYTSLLIMALSGLLSCNKQYDTKVVDSQTNGSNSNSNSSFNWTGTAPLSAKVNGTPFLATNATVTLFAGYYMITGKAADGSSISPSIPVTAAEGQIYSMPSPANVNWQESATPRYVLGASPGKCKIVTNNTTTLEGYFWADMKDHAGLTDTVVHLTEGYFKVDKP